MGRPSVDQGSNLDTRAGEESGSTPETAGAQGGATGGITLSAGAESTSSGGTAGGALSAGEMSAGEMSAGEMSAGEMTDGGMSGAETEVMMSDCATSCVEFAQCAVAVCAGYDGADIGLLIEGCVGFCLPELARIFDGLASCPDKVQFATTVNWEFKNFCDSVTDGFCETYQATCGAWLADVPCETLYTQAPESGPNPLQGAHRRCYEYHLGAAMVAEREGDEAELVSQCTIASGSGECAGD
jgi:hypothetical protein